MATFKPLAKGQTLYAVGDTPSDFWVVAHGEVVRDYQDGSAPQTLKVGSYFGEGRSGSRALNLVRSCTWCVSIKHRSVIDRQAHVQCLWLQVGILLPDTKCFATVTSTMETRLLSISKASLMYRMQIHGMKGRLHTNRTK